MDTKEPLKSEVRILAQSYFGGRGNAFLELRGTALLLSQAKGHHFFTQCFNTTSATIERKSFRADYVIHISLFITIALLCVGYPLLVRFSGPLHPGVLAIAIMATVATVSSTIVVIWFQTSAAHLRLNLVGTVYDLVLEHNEGASPTLDSILAHLRPFERTCHRFKPEKYVGIDSNLFRAFPARVALYYGGSAFALTFILLLIPIQIYQIFDLDPALPFWMLPLFIILPLMVCGCFACWQLRKSRGDYQHHAELRKVLRLLSQGDTASAESAIQELSLLKPEDTDLLFLLAHINITTGNYTQAEEYLRRVPDVKAGFQKVMIMEVDEIRSMELK